MPVEDAADARSAGVRRTVGIGATRHGGTDVEAIEIADTDGRGVAVRVILAERKAAVEQGVRTTDGRRRGLRDSDARLTGITREAIAAAFIRSFGAAIRSRATGARFDELGGEGANVSPCRVAADAECASLPPGRARPPSSTAAVEAGGSPFGARLAHYGRAVGGTAAERAHRERQYAYE